MCCSTQKITHRNSPQRELIYSTLKKAHSHPTAQQIHMMVCKKNPSISIGTVYRNLEILEKQGRILKLKTKDDTARFDGCTKAHAHLWCEKCNRVKDIFDITDVVIKSKSLKNSKFTIYTNYLELHGICHRCRKHK